MKEYRITAGFEEDGCQKLCIDAKVQEGIATFSVSAIGYRLSNPELTEKGKELLKNNDSLVFSYRDASKMGNVNKMGNTFGTITVSEELIKEVIYNGYTYRNCNIEIPLWENGGEELRIKREKEHIAYKKECRRIVAENREKCRNQ